jgi:hypothetical protein
LIRLPPTSKVKLFGGKGILAQAKVGCPDIAA